MIYYLPLEHLDKRYTVLMDQQIERELKRQKKKYKKIDGEVLSSDIETGAFLDSDSTVHFKMSQIMKIAKLFKRDEIKDGDLFFVSDLWFPGIEAIKYMAFFHRIQVKVKGILHAGSFTETDYVRGLEDWAQWIERGWFKMFDEIFLGSNFIKQELVEKSRIIDFTKLRVTGLPFVLEDYYKIVKPTDEKEDIVIFSGRLDDEKQPWIFDRLAKRFPNVKFIKTMELNLNKKEYLKLLSKSKIFFSSALQENFGYSALEACAYNLHLVVPNRLVYPEFYPEKYLYNTIDQAEEMIRKFLNKKADTVKYAKKQEKGVINIVKAL